MSKLFSPITIRNLTVKNRLWVSPMCMYSCENKDGVVGDFHLVLPPQFKTSLSGRVELFSDGLRYTKDGQVSRQIDSLDTLKYVIEDYLQRRFVTRQVQLQPLAALSFPAERFELQVQALIAGQQQRVDMVLKKSLNRGWAVESDSFASLPEPAAAPSTPVRSEVVAAPPERVSRPLDRRIRFSLDALLRSLFDDGLVEARVGKKDKRERHLYLTEKGAALERSLSDAQRARMRAGLSTSA